MRKLAIFVEGQTEMIFVGRLLEELAGSRNVFIVRQKRKTSPDGRRAFMTISATHTMREQKFFVLIRNSESDSRVKSDMIDAYDTLVKRHYQKIIGLRDVYPLKHSDISRLRKGLRFQLPKGPPGVNITLSVMEIEAWFMAETSHYHRLHEDLTRENIKKRAYLDPWTDDVETRSHPADDLKKIYRVAGLVYNKKRSNVQRTVNALDYEKLNTEVRKHVRSLDEFIGEINGFLEIKQH